MERVMKEFLEPLLGEGSSFNPRFTQAIYPYKKERPPGKDPLSANWISAVLMHPHVLMFLDPSDLVSIWTSSMLCWKSLDSKAKRGWLLQSVFLYFRISQEAALRVHRRFVCSWSGMLPTFVQLCRRFKHNYYPFEPDPIHRAFVAEQVCFWECCFLSLAGTLACYESRDQYVDLANDAEKLLPLPLNVLKERCNHIDLYYLVQFRWGDPTSRHDPVDDPENHHNPFQCFNQKNRNWMKAHADQAPREYYKYRLQSGLYPRIVLSTMTDTEGGIVEYSLAVGKDREQFVVCTYSRHDLLMACHDLIIEKDQTFCYCMHDDSFAAVRGGYLGYLLGYTCTKENDNGYVDLDAHEGQTAGEMAAPSLGIAIWAMRHSFQPLTDLPMEDWKNLIRRVIDSEKTDEEDSDEEGTDTDTDEEERFYTQALTSPLYGPANLDEWMPTVQCDNASVVEYPRQLFHHEWICNSSDTYHGHYGQHGYFIPNNF